MRDFVSNDALSYNNYKGKKKKKKIPKGSRQATEFSAANILAS